MTLSAHSQTQCYGSHDVNGNGTVDIGDFLSILGVFGDIDTDGDGVWDSVDNCTDLNACNYDYIPAEPCAYDDAIGICGGWCESDENGDGNCDFTCGVDSIEYHGYSYATVQIGAQCWFAENLRTELYSNGDSIPQLWGSEAWGTTTEGAQNFYEDDENNLNVYGRFYNYFAVEDSRGICPASWHVPTDEEFMELELEIGMNPNLVVTQGWRETDSEGRKLMSEQWWLGTNQFGFNALPAGIGGGSFGGQGDMTMYWCSLPNTYYQRIRKLQTDSEGIGRGWEYEWAGLSIRCLRD